MNKKSNNNIFVMGLMILITLIIVGITCSGFTSSFIEGIKVLVISFIFTSIIIGIIMLFKYRYSIFKNVTKIEKKNDINIIMILIVFSILSITCGGFIPNFKKGIFALSITFLIISIICLIILAIKYRHKIINKNSSEQKKTTMDILFILITFIFISITGGSFLYNLKVGIKFLVISFIIAGLLLFIAMLCKTKGTLFGRCFNDKTNKSFNIIMLLISFIMISITYGGFFYNFKIGMVFLIISLIFTSLLLLGVLNLKPRVDIFKTRAKIQNLWNRDFARISTLIFCSIFIGITLSGTLAYFTSVQDDIVTQTAELIINYNPITSGGGDGNNDNGSIDESGEITLPEDEEKSQAMIYFKPFWSGEVAIYGYNSDKSEDDKGNSLTNSWPGSSKELGRLGDYYTYYLAEKDNYTNAKIIFNNNLSSSESIEKGKRQFPPQNISGVDVEYGKSLLIEPYGEVKVGYYPKYIVKEYIDNQWKDRELYYYAYDTASDKEATSRTYCKKDITNNKLYVWVWNSTNSNGNWQEISCVDNGITFYFDNTSKNLDKVYFYVWNTISEVKFTSDWPGSVASTISGTNIYKMEVNSNNINNDISSSNLRFIINNNSKKTGDIEIPANTRIAYVNKDNEIVFFNEDGECIGSSSTITWK